MLGFIHRYLEAMIVQQHGSNTWQRILQKSGYDVGTQWEWGRQYGDDEESLQLFNAVAFTLGITVDDFLEAFGAWFVDYAMNSGWSLLLNSVASDLHDFLDNLPYLHACVFQLALGGTGEGEWLTTSMRMPKVKCEARADGSLRLHYYSSRRGLAPWVRGLVKQAAKVLFNREVKMLVVEHNLERRTVIGDIATRGDMVYEHVVFSVEPLHKSNLVAAAAIFPNGTFCNSAEQTSSSGSGGDGQIAANNSSATSSQFATTGSPVSGLTIGLFAAMFPTHVCFNKQMLIEHCGEFLYHELEMAKRRTCKLGDLFSVVQPDDVPFTFKGLATHLNSIYIFRLKQPIKRKMLSSTAAPKQLGVESTVTTLQHSGGVSSGGGGGSSCGSGTASASGTTTGGHQHTQAGGQNKQYLALKGQMLLVNNGNCLLFMCSQHLSTVHGLKDASLYISDLQRHDATRDLIMLNQSRLSQQELNKRLEESAKRMEFLAEELEQGRDRNSQLSFDFLPSSVAELVKKDETDYNSVAAKEFAEATCLQCEIPDFILINRHCDPKEMVTLITELSHRFDSLIARYDCYKVLTLMDIHFIVAGVPTYQANHAEQICNLALGMMAEAKRVQVPGIGLPLMLRMGIHSGPVVAGVVGKTRVRYCVIGETVNIAKRLTHHVEIGRILITSATKSKVDRKRARGDSAVVAAGDEDQFEFTNKGYLKIGEHQATCTFYLERNLRKSVWELIGMAKPTDKAADGPGGGGGGGGDDSVSGYSELNNGDDIRAWQTMERNMRTQRRTLEALQSLGESTAATTTATPQTVMDARLRSIKSLWRNTRQSTGDSGISAGSGGSGGGQTTAAAAARRASMVRSHSSGSQRMRGGAVAKAKGNRGSQSRLERSSSACCVQ